VRLGDFSDLHDRFMTMFRQRVPIGEIVDRMREAVPEAKNRRALVEALRSSCADEDPAVNDYARRALTVIAESY
jgi:hypothetical protein